MSVSENQHAYGGCSHDERGHPTRGKDPPVCGERTQHGLLGGQQQDYNHEWDGNDTIDDGAPEECLHWADRRILNEEPGQYTHGNMPLQVSHRIRPSSELAAGVSWSSGA